MITNITIVEPSSLPIEWWSKNKRLKSIKEVDFKPGLNIIIGKNNSGKSSLLTLMAKMFYAERDRFPTLSNDNILELFPVPGKAKVNYLSSVKVSFDNNIVCYYDPMREPKEMKVSPPNVSPAQANNFPVNHPMANHMRVNGHVVVSQPSVFYTKSVLVKNSSIQIMKDIGGLITKMQKTKTPIYKLEDRKRLSNLWVRRLEKVEEWLKPNVDMNGLPTILLDEPDRIFDLSQQQNMWKVLSKVASEKAQVIIASHSLFGMNIPNANYIELTPGYHEQCQNAINMLIHQEIKTEEDKELYVLEQMEITKQKSIEA
jgi:energy-coupling factor transporter ATP-binding protein EcfA2